MPRRTRSFGRPGTAVFPPGWSASHGRVMDTTHTATCSIRRPGGGTTLPDPATGTRTNTPNAPHFTGSCSVAYLRAETLRAAGEEALPTARAEVALSRDDAPDAHTGDLVTFTAVDGDADATLLNTVLVVVSIDRDSKTWERILICSENQS